MGGKRDEPITCDVEGAELLERALAAGRGVIMVTAHTGGWETVGPAMKRRFGLDIMVAMQREPDARARDIQDRARIRSGIRVAHIDNEPLSVLPLLAHLRRGGALGVQIDRVPAAMRALAVRLFGEPAGIPSGPFHLARASGAPILPVFMRRIGFFHYEVRLYPVIEVTKTAGDRELGEAAQRAASDMEQFIREHPTDWFDFRAEPPSGGVPGSEK
jgi:KDO2-lipid IV(A) lauroyltransferase